MDDILIRGGQVIDGTGAPARVADVAIRAGRIVAIEPDRADSADRVIDARSDASPAHSNPGIVAAAAFTQWRPAPALRRQRSSCLQPAPLRSFPCPGRRFAVPARRTRTPTR